MRLDLFSLKLFVDVVELGSIGKGAEKNCIAMSAGSKRMAELEHTFGAQLLQRQPRGVVVTPVGATLYQGVKETLNRLQQVAAAVSEEASGSKRPVRLLSNLTSMVHYLPEALKAFAEQHPAIPIELEERATAETLQAVSRGEADIGIVAPILPYPDNLVSFRYRVMSHVLAVPPDHPLAEFDTITFDQAAEHDFVGLESEGGWDQLLRKVAQERACRFKVRVRVSSFDAMCRMVASGLGIAIVPSPTARSHAVSMGLHLVALNESWAEVPMDMCTRDPHGLSCNARLLLNHLREHRGHEFYPGRAALPAPDLTLFPAAAERALSACVDLSLKH